MTEGLTATLATRPDAEWWVLPDMIWCGPRRWLSGVALRMRGLAVAGDFPVPVHQVPDGARVLEFVGMLLPGLQDATFTPG